MKITLQDLARIDQNTDGKCALKYDANNLLPLVVQDALSGRVLMLGYVNREAIEITLREDKVTFFSRSKSRLWTKGETSGNFLHLQSLWLDCDNDTLLALVIPSGPTCHLGTRTCFDQTNNFPDPKVSILCSLEETLKSAAESNLEDPGSYSQKLLKAPLDRVVRKLFEEWGEWVCALKNFEKSNTEECQKELCAETCDIVFHMMVLLQKSGISLAQCFEELQNRVGKRRVQDGTVEKL